MASDLKMNRLPNQLLAPQQHLGWRLAPVCFLFASRLLYLAGGGRAGRVKTERERIERERIAGEGASNLDE